MASTTTTTAANKVVDLRGIDLDGISTIKDKLSVLQGALDTAVGTITNKFYEENKTVVENAIKGANTTQVFKDTQSKVYQELGTIVSSLNKFANTLDRIGKTYENKTGSAATTAFSTKIK